MQRFIAITLLIASCHRAPGNKPADDDTSTRPDTDVPSGTTTDTAAAPTDTGVAPATTEVVTSGRITCPEPALREQDGPYLRVVGPAEADKALQFIGGGAIVADLTADPGVDIILPGAWQTFTFRATGDGLPVPTTLLDGHDLADGTGGSTVDIDADGDLDLLITRFARRDVLLRNDDGVFVDISNEVGLGSQAPTRSIASSWGDLDHDGDLDLFIGSYGDLGERGQYEDRVPADPSYLYLNDGTGYLVDHSDWLPRHLHDGYTFSGGFHDLDGDLRPELYVVNDFGIAYPNVLLWYRDGALVADDGASGLELGSTFMGLAVEDLNGDGVPDLFMSRWRGLTLLESTSAGPWVDATNARGLVVDRHRRQTVPWGTDLADLDNDGDLDALVAIGHIDAEYNNAPQQPDAAYEQLDDGSFVDRAPEWGLDQLAASRGFVTTDLDGDGWLDIVKRDLDGPSRIFLSRCGTGSWLEVSLRMPGLNTRAIGARIEVVAGEARFTRWIRAGGVNFASAGPADAHLGLGAATVVDEIRITWPDGLATTHTDVEVDQRLVFTRRR